MSWTKVFENPLHQDKRREAVWAALWEDPKYLRLQKRKDEIARQWNWADSRKGRGPVEAAEAERLSKIYKRANQRIYKYENEALRKAGFTP